MQAPDQLKNFAILPKIELKNSLMDSVIFSEKLREILSKVA